jgi:acetolactate synthase-1/3 small subunit
MSQSPSTSSRKQASANPVPRRQHTISILVENKFGAFNRISGLFAAKGYNIDSLTVGPTEDETVSRMTIVTEGDDPIIEQITKQLHKLIDQGGGSDL